ncbi:MAG: purine-nucleoside phosphorylase [Myxococcaceae bacterium]|nr:purine-nucleoside phosphorylase [Myxococcaceae bacterium]MBH2005874.1 purine-nucleoside phosphorylase [Myxococcaceae bacterium]
MNEEIIESPFPKTQVAVILGSGLGEFADCLSHSDSLSYGAIRDFPKSTVEGHSGRFVHGYIASTPVLLMQGRVHRYEGYTAQQVAFPIRVLKAWGIEKLVITNAAGGIHPDFNVGDLMLITDHLNLTGDSPLLGPNRSELGPRFPDMSEAYSKRLRDLALQADTSLRQGVYAGLLGPCYETPAEVRMLKTLGADAVGMSTVFETIAARHMGLEVLGISCISNQAAGLSNSPLSHAEVTLAGQKASKRFSELLLQVIPKLTL